MLHGIAQLFQSNPNDDYFNLDRQMVLQKAQTTKEDPYAFEKAIVQSCECDESWPVCLYDCTLRNLLPDQQVLSVARLD